MKHAHLLLSGLLQLTSFSLMAQTLDQTFSGDGRANTTISVLGGGSSMAIQPADQKIIVAGRYNDGNGTNTNLAVVRYLPNGTLDPNFGSGGKLLLPFGINGSGAVAVALQSDGKILLLGNFYMSSAATAVLVRLTTSGTLDAGFSPAGYIQLPYPGTGNALVVQPDNKILVGGSSGSRFCVGRFTKDGMPDASFGAGGQTFAQGSEVRAMAVESDGGIIAMGISGDVTLKTVRFKSTGVVDSSFGSYGISTVTVNGNDLVQGWAICLQSDGLILLAGNYKPAPAASNYQFLIVRLRADGTLDNTFAGNGKLGVPFSGYDASASGIVQQYQGQIVVAGNLTPRGPAGNLSKFGLCRLNVVNGALDNSFGNGGLVITGWPNAAADAYAVALQNDGKIVAGGSVGANGFAVARYLSPIVPPRLPFVTASPGVTVQNVAPPGIASLHIFPNPASSLLQVQGLDVNALALLTVRDAAGKAILVANAEGQSNFSLDIHGLAPGIYFLEVISGDKRKSFAFMKRQ